MKFSTISLLVEAASGASLEDALADAVDASCQFNLPVTLVFNGLHLPVNGKDSVIALLGWYAPLVDRQ